MTPNCENCGSFMRYIEDDRGDYWRCKCGANRDATPQEMTDHYSKKFHGSPSLKEPSKTSPASNILPEGSFPALQRKVKAILGILAIALVGIPSAFAFSGINLPVTVSSNVVYSDPPLQVVSASENGSPCSVSGSSITCYTSFIFSAVNSLSLGFLNPASASQSVHTVSSAPSGCLMSFTDAPSTAIPASGSATLTVSISVSASASVGMACSFSTLVTS